MGQGQQLTDDQIETIRAAWLLTENGSEAARQAGCSPSAACAYIRTHGAELRTLRTEKAPDLIDVIRALLDRTLSYAFDGKKLNDATFSQVVTGIGILVDKYQLVSGAATARTEVTVRQKAETIAKELGVSVDELLDEAEAIAAGSWDAWPPE